MAVTSPADLETHTFVCLYACHFRVAMVTYLIYPGNDH